MAKWHKGSGTLGHEIRLMILMLFTAGCSGQITETRSSFSLAGEWEFRIDSLDQGIEREWFKDTFSESVHLPGSMAENGKGNEVTLKTDWTGDIFDKSYFTEKKYEKYRRPGNIKIPFWLKPVKYYKGAAWYQKDFELPEGWQGKHVMLFLERCHWKSTVFVNGIENGSQTSLATPHQYNITGSLVPGKNRITIRMDNRVIIPVGVNSHSISDHTQSNWNGITGDISLRAGSETFIDDVRIYPDLQKKSAKVVVSISNSNKAAFKGKLTLYAESFNSARAKRLGTKSLRIDFTSDRNELVIDYPMGNGFEKWSEFNPAIYRLSVILKDSDGKVADISTEEFGMREFKTKGTRFEVNDIPVFLRGTTECCIFPLTGYPPSDIESWEKVLRTVKDYGMNHVRFHSFCPPEAAFIAADRLGIYFHVECSSWANQGSSIGSGSTLDKFIYEESENIIREYGNHPSFCMLAYGNEPAGRNQGEYLGKLITYWKSIDNRRVYTSGAGWPIIPENDYNLPSDPRIQHWGEGLKSIINAEPPQTMFDYNDFVSKFNVPTVSHEIGQWCVYPDFKEIVKYTGVLKPTNFEIFRETLTENHMADRAEDFLMASGKLQVFCYKADIEAALRTPGFGGFQILQLHDFPGQGTALVGILNPFFESKGYITPGEFRMFCNQTVPLARIKKMVYKNNETFEAGIEIAHFGPEPIRNAEIICQMKDSAGQIIRKEVIKTDEIKIGNAVSEGSFTMAMEGIKSPQKLNFEVSVAGTSFKNSWDLWVYPETQEIVSGNVLVTEKFDDNAEAVLKNGGSVLFLPFGNIGQEKGSKVAIGFSSIFWNTAWTNNQAPHTLGILCDPSHPLFSEFPTEYHSNWQWWDPVTHSQAMILEGFPADMKILIQPIDTWFENRQLALAFEVKTGGGKLLVCSIDMKGDLDERPVTRQLLTSVLKYMNSDKFNPEIPVNPEIVTNLIK